MKIENIKIQDLKPYAKNAKVHTPEQVEQIANSIKGFGFKQPLVVTKDNVVIVGHGRLEGAKLLNLETVPCVIAEDLDEVKAKAYRLADNKLNESDWDKALLVEEIDLLQGEGFLIQDIGFDSVPELEDIDFDNIESTEGREKTFKDQLVTCPDCKKSFNIKV